MLLLVPPKDGGIEIVAFGSVWGSMGDPAAINPSIGTSNPSGVSVTSVLSRVISSFPFFLLINHLSSILYRCS